LSYSRRGPAGPRRALPGQWQAARARSSTPGGPRSAAAPAALGCRSRGGPNAADSAVSGTGFIALTKCSTNARYKA